MTTNTKIKLVDLYIQPVTPNQEPISEPILSGRSQPNSNTTVLAPVVDGYETEANQLTLQVDGTDAYLKLVYTPRSDNPLVVQAATPAGKALGSPQQIGEGETSSTVFVALPVIEGYVPESDQVEFQVKAGKNVMPVTYLPAKNIPVTVTCINPAGDVLLETTVEGETDSILDVDAPEVAGYGPENKSMEQLLVKPTDNAITFKYSPRADNKIVLHFIDVRHNDISEPVTKMGVTDSVFAYASPEFEGYKALKPEVRLAKVPVGVTHVNVEYQAKQVNRIIVEPQTEDGKPLDQIAVVGMAGIGDTVKVDLPTITGYHPAHSVTIDAVIKGDNIQTVSYQPNDNNPIMMKLVLTGTDQQVGKTEVGYGTTHERFETDTPNVPGYLPVNKTVSVSDVPIGGKTVTVAYAPAPERLIVKYVTNDGETIAADREIIGDYESSYSVMAPTIEGYTLLDEKHGTMQTGTFTHDDDQEVSFVYVRSAKKAKVQIFVVDTNGTKIRQAEMSGLLGDPYVFEAPDDLEGYVNTGDRVIKGTYGDGQLVRKFVFAPAIKPESVFDDADDTDIVKQQANVTVQVVTDNGEVLYTKAISGSVGQSYQINLPQYDGYLPDTDVVRGFFNAGDVTQSIIYHQLTVKEEQEKDPDHDLITIDKGTEKGVRIAMPKGGNIKADTHVTNPLEQQSQQAQQKQLPALYDENLSVFQKIHESWLKGLGRIKKLFTRHSKPAEGSIDTDDQTDSRMVRHHG